MPFLLVAGTIIPNSVDEDDCMLWYALAQLFSTIPELMRVVQLSSDERDLEILILRQQLDVLARKNAQVIRPSRLERWSLAGLAATLKKRGRLTNTQLGNVIRIVKPETVIKWNRQRPLQSSQQVGDFFHLSSGRSIEKSIGLPVWMASAYWLAPNERYSRTFYSAD